MVPSSSGHRHVFQTLCKCGLGLARRISWTEMNLARRFLVCPRPSPSPQRFDAFYWIDGELFSDWYRNMMYEMNNTMNPDHREIFEDVVHRHEMEIVSQERISILEEELESHKSSNFDELEKAIVKAASWKKIACVLIVGTLTGDEVFAKKEVPAKCVNLTVDEVTLAQVLADLKSVKPKVKRDVIKEPSVAHYAGAVLQETLVTAIARTKNC
ncbi:hypothetical protein Tco_0078661 [Tanacetum coccineum]